MAATRHAPGVPNNACADSKDAQQECWPLKPATASWTWHTPLEKSQHSLPQIDDPYGPADTVPTVSRPGSTQRSRRWDGLQ